MAGISEPKQLDSRTSWQGNTASSSSSTTFPGRILTERSSDIFSFSCLCVVSSWGSFLIAPKVLSYTRDERHDVRNIIPRWFRAESAFLSPSSFPSLHFSYPQYLRLLRYHTTVYLYISPIHGLGLAGTNCPDFLGSCPLPLHIWGNNRLRGAAHPHPLPHW